MNDFLVGILSGINSVVHNYGWSIVVFTLLIRLILSPLDFKSRKSMRKMSKLQPEMAKLQKKYANDKEKLNMKTSELYRREKINPLAGCVPMLLSFPVLIAMFGAMRHIANMELAKQAIDLITTGVQVNEPWLWVKNLWMPDSPFYAMIADHNSLKLIPADIWAKVFTALSPEKISALGSLGNGLAITAQNISGETIFAALSQSPVYAQQMELWSVMPSVNLLITQVKIYANANGWFLLPLLSGVTSFLLTMTQPQQPMAGGENTQAASTNKMMKYFMPVFSLWICWSYNAGFALYWVAANVISGAQGILFNKYFDAQDKKAAQVSVGEGSVK